MRPITKKHTRTLAVMIPLLLGTIYANAQQQQDLSVEQTEIIKISGITTEDMIYGLNATQKTTSKTYYDGLRRPVQQALVQGSPTQKDIIQPIGYDNQGRQNRGYLPYVGTDGSGNFRPNALTSEQPAFYNNGTSDKIADDTNPYSEQLFENSPLQRVLSAGGVGNDFQPLSGQHYSSMSYRSNTAADGNIIMWSPEGSNTGNYGVNALSVTKATDTEGHKAVVFTDDLGRTILKRQVVNTTTNNDTYYIYNNAGLVSYVLPPKAVNLLAANNSYTLSTAIISKLIFTYTYDDKGRLTEKTIP
ncbi:DUF6443 domain-containing protein, partial [Mucilaginibacter sp. UR6-1]|uniref:DUF6443 domain-containing protein n=1 Tax=Mucilaginibacter sp. UR6-1 TaxID=1435643 RepID=UPI001E3462FA